MNQPNRELTEFPSATKQAMSSVYEKCSTSSWEQHELESTTVLPPPGYRYPRRGAFTHSDLIGNAVIASIESSGSFDGGNFSHYNISIKTIRFLSRIGYRS